MEWIIKALPVSALYGVISLLVTKLGISLKNKDANASGADDAAGDILIALAPAVAALEGNNDKALRKALTVVRSTIDNYLKSSPA